MKRLLLALLLLFPFFAKTQTDPTANGREKPASETTSGKDIKPANTQPAIWFPIPAVRAVVIGISDYQSPQIPDLRFADRDAMAFADWLKSPAGGSVPEDNIRLLTNEIATKAAIVIALYDLLDSCKVGDMAVFYFSGHGDVENKLRSLQPGFLLAHDSPPKVYSTNAVDLRDLNDLVNELAHRQVRIVLITDACHAGKLAGSSFGGSQATALALQQQFANAVKIMSCQPDEFSLEGVEWGGGRGVFSFHLVEGLIGMADNNTDYTVNLFEVGRYLEDRVPAATAPHPQMPLTVGDRNFRLANVNEASLSELKQQKTSTGSLSNTDSKGIEDTVLARADSLTRSRYRTFQRALRAGDLLSDTDSSANVLFGHLMAVEVLAPLHGILRRNFAVALLDEVQQAINALLADDPYETNNWRYNPDRYEKYPAYLKRTMELLGEGHYTHRSVLSKLRYFEGYLFSRKTVDMSEAAIRDSLREVTKNKYLEAADLEPGAAYIYHAIGALYAINNPTRIDSMLIWHKKAVEYAPSWKLPYLDLSYEYQISLSDLQRAEFWLNKALEHDQDSYVVLERLSWLYQWQNRTLESLALCDTMISRKPDLFNAYSTKGVTYLMRNEYTESAACLRRSIEMEPSLNNWATYYYNQLLGMIRAWPKSKSVLKKALLEKKMDTFHESGFILTTLQPLYFQNIIGEAEPYFKQLVELQVYPGHIAAGLTGLGVIQYKNGKLQEAEAYIIKALETDPVPSQNVLLSNTYLALIVQKRGEIAKADSLFQLAFKSSQTISALDKSFVHGSCRLAYGQFLMQQKRYDEALKQFRLAEEFHPKCFQAQYGYALIAAHNKRHDEALDYLEKALDYWLPEAEPMLEEPLFKKIRKTKRFKTLMLKHFPDQVKD
ncbi:MAG: caspase family protein, partial [Saprospiraceae bacterium]